MLNSGGIYNTKGTLSLTDCLVCGNTSNLYGGGIFNYFGSVTLINCTVSGNSAETGGGIYNASQRAVLEIFNSVIALNTVSKADPDLCNYYSFGTAGKPPSAVWSMTRISRSSPEPKTETIALPKIPRPSTREIMTT